MTEVILIALGAFITSWMLVRWWIAIARRTGIVDVPNARSSHTRVTPRGGGVGIVLTVLLGGVLLAVLGRVSDPAALAWAGGLALGIAVVSFVDDLRPLPSVLRLGFQLVVALVVVAKIGAFPVLTLPFVGTVGPTVVRSEGERSDGGRTDGPTVSLSDRPTETPVTNLQSPVTIPPWLFVAVTVLWIIGLTNVYNFMDGIDGIAGSQAVITGLAWALVALVAMNSDQLSVISDQRPGIAQSAAGQEGDGRRPESGVQVLRSDHQSPITDHQSPLSYPIPAAAALLLAASAAGFLLHNWSPAKVFMGDVGSAFLGFCFAVLPLLVLRHAAARGVAPETLGTLPVFAVAVVWPFVGDGIFTFLRRVKHRENVLKAHRSHLYQRLTIHGWPHARVTMLYVGWALLCVVAANIYLAGGNAWRGLAISILITSVLGMFAFVKNVERQGNDRRSVPRDWETAGRPGDPGSVIGGERESPQSDHQSPITSHPVPLPSPITNPESQVTAADAGGAVTPPRLHLSPPHLGTEEFRFVQEAFASNWVAPAGPHLRAFEREFAALVGLRHAVAVDSGTAALHLAMKCVGVRPGDEVFVSTFTFAASANPAVYEGAKPVFIGSEEISWNMDPARLRDALADRARKGRLPRAVVLVHVYGESADVDAIASLCREYEVPLVEDAAEAVGARYKDRYVGTTGLLGAFSFNGNKIITSSGGGMLASNDAKLIDYAHVIATQARDAGAHYEHSQIGYNYRLSNVLAGIGRGQLRVLEERVAARRRIFSAYHSALSPLPGLAFMPEAPWGRSTRWLTCLTIDPQKSGGVDREKVRLALEAANIEARPLWKPLHLQPVFQKMGCEIFGGKVSERLFANGLCLPSGSAMTQLDIDRVVGVVRRCWDKS